jgi:hypothetical protein
LIHGFRLAHEGVDGLGHEALVEGIARRLDLSLAVAALGFSLADDALPGVGKLRVAEELAGLGDLAAGQEDAK